MDEVQSAISRVVGQIEAIKLLPSSELAKVASFTATNNYSEDVAAAKVHISPTLNAPQVVERWSTNQDVLSGYYYLLNAWYTKDKKLVAGLQESLTSQPPIDLNSVVTQTISKLKKEYFLWSRKSVIGGAFAVAAILGVNIWLGAYQAVSHGGAFAAERMAQQSAKNAQQAEHQASESASQIRALLAGLPSPATTTEPAK